MAGRPAAQERAFAAGQHRRRVPGHDARRSVPDAVHPRILGKQRRLANSPLNPGRRQTGAKELRPRHHSMLAARNPRYLVLGIPAWRSHTDL
jgi:hypothetical protein